MSIFEPLEGAETMGVPAALSYRPTVDAEALSTPTSQWEVTRYSIFASVSSELPSSKGRVDPKADGQALLAFGPLSVVLGTAVVPASCTGRAQWSPLLAAEAAQEARTSISQVSLVETVETEAVTAATADTLQSPAPAVLVRRANKMEGTARTPALAVTPAEAAAAAGDTVPQATEVELAAKRAPI